MVNMLIDTSIWLGLAKDPKDGALIGALEKLVEQRLLTLLVPRLVLEEFLRNRDRVAADHGKRISVHFRVVREAVEVSGLESADIAEANRILQDVDQRSAARAKFASQVFRRVEGLLKSTAPLEPSPEVKMAVFQRAVDGRAPFHQNENEAADAVIAEIFAECVRSESKKSKSRWIFVTRNTEHFSSGKGSDKKAHPDFTCFDDGQAEYYISLPEALRSVEPSLVEQLLQTWEGEQPTVADLIDRFIDEAPNRKPLGTSHRYTLSRLRDGEIGTKVAAKLQPRDIVRHCRIRNETVVGATIRQDVGYLRSVLNVAEYEWEVLGVSADVADDALKELEGLELVGYSYALQGRRPTSEEIERLIEYFRLPPKKPRKNIIDMVPIVEFAVASGRRIQEIHSLLWSEFDEQGKTCKIGGKTFPVLDEALTVIKRQPRKDSFIFGRNAKSAGAAFLRAKKELEIKGLRFQDLRREAVMRMLAAKVPLEQIEAATGLGALSLSRYRSQFAGGGNPTRTPWRRSRKLRFSPRG